MSYPKIVYHKDFDAKNATEKTLKEYARFVKNEEDHKHLGSDYVDHPVLSGEKHEEPVEKKAKKAKYSPGEGE